MLKDQMPESAADIKTGQRLFLGFIDSFSTSEGATVRFLNGFTRKINARDVDNNKSYKAG
jgi:hypothetical protein